MTDDRKARMTSVLGETAVVVGNVRGLGDLEIRGRVQGSVELQGRVLVAASGVVLGDVEATTIIVSGEVRGDLTARETVLIEGSGQVEGNITAPRVGVETGARVHGNLRTGEAVPTAPTLFETSPDEWPAAQPPSETKENEEEKAAVEVVNKQGRTRPRKRKRPRKAGEPHLPGLVAALPAFQPSPTTTNRESSTKTNGEDPTPPAASPKGGTPRTDAQADAKKHPQADAQKRAAGSEERRGPPRPPTFVKGAKGHQRA